ncbi:MAG: transposase family protein [Cyanobacteriota bacterium]|nr:transposase family protein [Cyanobacteriota bacterium]
MKPKSYLKLISRFLSISGIWVSDYQILDGIGIVFKLEPQAERATCPHCQATSERVTQNHRYLVKDLPLSTHSVYLQVNRRQFTCNCCQKTFTEELDYVNLYRNYTRRFAVHIVGQVLDSNIEYVAQRNSLSKAEVQIMVNDFKQGLTPSTVS